MSSLLVAFFVTKLGCLHRDPAVTLQPLGALLKDLNILQSVAKIVIFDNSYLLYLKKIRDLS